MAATETKSLSRQALWVVGGRSIGIGATFAANVLAARLLGPAEYGSFLLISTLLALGAMLAMVGLNEAGLRFVAESLGRSRHDLAKQYAVGSLRVAAAATALVSPLLGFAAVFLVGGTLLSRVVMACLVAIGIAGLVWQKLGTELTRAYGDLRWVSFLSGGQTGGPLSNLVFVLGLGAVGAGLLRAEATTAFALLVASILVTAPFVVVILWHALSSTASHSSPETADLAPPPPDGGALLPVAAFIFANQLLGFAAQQVDLWLAGALLSSDAVGLFGAAKRAILVVAMPVQMAMMTIVGVIPRLHAMNRPAELERTVRSAATAAAVPSLIALAAIIMLPRLSLQVVFGDAYVGAAAPLLALAFGQVVLVFSGNPQHVLTMTGRHRAVLLINFVAAIILVGGGAIGAWQFGATGLAAASAASLAFQNAACWWVVRRELGIWTHVSLSSIATSAMGRISARRPTSDDDSPDALATTAISSTTAG